MKKNANSLLLGMIFFLPILFISSCADDDPKEAPSFNADINEDGEVNILVLGTSRSVDNNTGSFSPNQIAVELKNILTSEKSIQSEVNIVAEDLYAYKVVSTATGGGGYVQNVGYSRHSLFQYYFWPEGKEDRIKNLLGESDYNWDYVVIAADPYIVGNTPGFYSLGVNKIADKVVEGGAVPLLLMVWPKQGGSIANLEEFTYRTSEGARTKVTTVPAGLVWDALSVDKKDTSSTNPTPNGAYLSAASIYAQIYGRSASYSDYSYDDEIADLALSISNKAATVSHFSGERTFISPFKACDLSITNQLSFNQSGSSSEAGIRIGLKWVAAKDGVSLASQSNANFNYGRANINFEADKRYKINPANFQFSLGFPMQDHKKTGDVSMLYGIDYRTIGGNYNGTDLGVAIYMIKQSELPTARAIPIRTLYALMKEVYPDQSAYRDNWHMNRDLDKASGAYMYTLLTGRCKLGPEPIDVTSAGWRTWNAHKIGYETAWRLMYLEGKVPFCD